MYKFLIDASNLEIDKSNCLNLNFDDLLENTWNSAEKNNVLKFKLSESVRKKKLDGKYSFLVYLNVNRLTMKRKAQIMNEIKVNVNSNEFNFTKINKNEILFDFQIQNLYSIDVLNSSIKGTIIVNNAPIEYCNSLLVLELEKCLPQICTKNSLLLAFYVLAASKNKSLRLGFNSSGANASVNHCHFHLYYQEEDLLIAKMKIQNYQLEDWFLKSFVFELDILNDKKPDSFLNLALNIENLLNFITEKLKLAYNLFLTKCSTNINLIRIIVWPRIAKFGSKDDSLILPALCELSGFFTCKQLELFDHVNELELIKLSKEFEINENQFNQILNLIQILFK